MQLTPSSCSRLGVVMGISLMVVCVSTSVGANDVAEIRSEIAQLKASNQQLAKRLDSQSTDWLNESRAKEIRAIVSDVLADSATRTSLQETGATAGYLAGEGFVLRNPSGDFSLRISGQIQTRFVFNNNSNGSNYTNADYINDHLNGTDQQIGNKNSWGFSVRRARLNFDGHIGDSSWQYKVGGTFQASTGQYQYDDLAILKTLENGLRVGLGQMKTPFLREELVSSRNQLAVERSMMNAMFSAKRSLGVHLNWRENNVSLQGYYGNGMRTALNNDQEYTNSSNNPTKWAFAGRAEFKLAGKWRDFKSFNTDEDQQCALMIGVAAMGQEYGANTEFKSLFGLPDLNNVLQVEGANLDGSTVAGVSADITAKFGRFSVFASAVWQQYDIEGSGGTIFGLPMDEYTMNRVNPWGILVQGGWSVSEDVELFARFAMTDADLGGFTLTSSGSGLPPIPTPPINSKTSILTLGANHFVNKNLKFTLDWSINFQDSIVGIDDNELIDLGWSPTNTADEWLFRAQMQLLF